MVTVSEFYKGWEGVEAKLIDITASPILAISMIAEQHLNKLYQLKGELDEAGFEPDRQILGIQTECYGRVSFESMRKFAESKHIGTSARYLLNHGATFSDAYMQEHGLNR